MAKIKGITVTLINKIETGKDGFGHPVYKESRVNVKNVLVAPAGTTEIVDMFNLTGKKGVYNLAIPKEIIMFGRTRKLKFFGELWQVIGLAQEGIADNIPLSWNQKWMVARYE